MIDEPFIEQFIRKEFRDEICDETKDRLKLLFTCLAESMDKTVDDRTLDLMKKYSLSLGEARVIAVKQMGKMVKSIKFYGD